MFRKRVKSSSKESKSSNKIEEHVETPTIEQIEAVRDLHSTYAHPMKCADRTSSRKSLQKNNLATVLKQREFGLINFHRYPTARHQTMDRYFDT